MASSPKLIVSEGEDYEIVQKSRQEKSTEKSIFKIDGTSGKPTFGQSPGGLLDSFVWNKDAADGGAGNATSEHIIMRAASGMTISAVNFLPDAALTADAANNATITLKVRNADGTNATTVASVTTSLTGSGNWTQWVAVALAITATAATLTAGQILTIQITKAGTGVIVPAGSLQIDYTQN